MQHGFCAQDEELRLEDLTEYSLYFEYSTQLPPEFSVVTSDAKKVGEVREQDLLWIFSLTNSEAMTDLNIYFGIRKER